MSPKEDKWQPGGRADIWVLAGQAQSLCCFLYPSLSSVFLSEILAADRKEKATRVWFTLRPLLPSEPKVCGRLNPYEYEKLLCGPTIKNSGTVIPCPLRNWDGQDVNAPRFSKGL